MLYPIYLTWVRDTWDTGLSNSKPAMQTNGIWEIYGDERDHTFVELVNIPVLELESVRVEAVELHLKDKTNTAANAHFIEQIHGQLLTDSQTTYRGSHGHVLYGVGLFKYKYLHIINADRGECIREFLGAVKRKIDE